MEAGENLGRVLNDRIDEITTDDRSRTDIVQDMADAAGIEPSTVNQILNGAIDCPPIDRLEAFAGVPDVRLDTLLRAAEASRTDPPAGTHEGDDGQGKRSRDRHRGGWAAVRVRPLVVDHRTSWVGSGPGFLRARRSTMASSSG